MQKKKKEEKTANKRLKEIQKVYTYQQAYATATKGKENEQYTCIG